MIQLRNISKSFDGKWAVRSLSLDVPKGEIFGLLGPNGAGKTTIIKIIIGLLISDEGSVSVCGYDITKEPVKIKSCIGYVPDKAFIYEKLTAREFLIFNASLRKIGKQEAQSRSERLLDKFGIKDAGDELIGGYSQGMKQRLLFASALIHEPEVILIDEPFAGLDPFGVILLKSTIKDLSSKGASVFLATHNLHVAEGLCDRVGIIDKGNMVNITSAKEFSGVEGGLETLFMKKITELQ